MSISNETLKSILSRRSCRRFLQEPIERHVLDAVIEAGAYAPSPLNNQPWRFIVLTRRETISKIARFVEDRTSSIEGEVLRGAVDEYNAYRQNAVFFEQAPAVIIVLMKPINNDSKGRLWGVPGFFKNERRARGDILSIGAACQNIMVAATSLGIGSCMMLYPLIADDDVRELLDIRFPWEIMAYIPLGRPSAEWPAAPKRRDLSKIVQYVDEKDNA